MNSSRFLKFVGKTKKFYATGQRATTPRIITPSPYLCMSTNASMSTCKEIPQSKEKETFQDTLPYVIDSLLSTDKLSAVPDVKSWLKKVLEYNLTGGKMQRGMITVKAYESFEKPENITEESLRLARTLGWCVEMLQAYYLISDDIMDGSSTRRGMPCWYRVPGVGLDAINDAILVHSSLYQVLKTHFSHLPQYTAIVDLFNQTNLYTSIGQCIDLSTAKVRHDYHQFTLKRYEEIVLNKTAYYTFRLPVWLGMLLANITSQQTLNNAEEICLEIGKFFQIQDDYIDCFGDERITGKIGTDIQEGKCSWLSVMALECSNPTQRALFEKCYGSKDSKDVETIKQLYDELELPRIYKERQKEHYDKIHLLSDKLHRETALSPQLFYKLADNIYNRMK